MFPYVVNFSTCAWRVCLCYLTYTLEGRVVSRSKRNILTNLTTKQVSICDYVRATFTVTLGDFR